MAAGEGIDIGAIFGRTTSTRTTSARCQALSLALPIMPGGTCTRTTPPSPDAQQADFSVVVSTTVDDSGMINAANEVALQPRRTSSA